MRVLVTGGTGFLGSALLGRLLERGHDVRVLVRPTSDLSGVPHGAEVAHGDVTDLDSVTRAAQGVECIVHMAALVQAWARDRSEFRRVNVGGLENVLQVMRESGTVTRLLYTSTFFALGPTDGAIADGSQEHAGRGFFTQYEETKFEADGIALRAAQQEGLHVVLVYPGVIYGPGRVSTSNLIVKMIVDSFRGRLPGLIGTGANLYCFALVSDVVAGMLAALDKGVPGKRYILGGENASLVEVFGIVRSLTGHRPPRLRIPIWVAKIIGALSEGLAYLGGPIPIFTSRSVEAMRHDWAYSSALARQDLAYSPLPLREGLQETLEWLRANAVISY